MKVLLIPLLLISFTAQAGVKKFHLRQFEHARKMQYISSQTLIVKISKGSSFPERSFYMGEFQPFFEAEDGIWGYLKLNMIPDSFRARFILDDLSTDKEVLHAYYAPIPKNAVFDEERFPERERDYVSTPDFEALQYYLEGAPRGIGARSAWEIPGGTGRNVKIIDIETCFEENHEDFNTPFFVGNNPACPSTNHGTAVWGILAAKKDDKGITGIVHEAEFGIYGFIEGNWDIVNDQYIQSINKGIQLAMQELDPGDILVIEQQMVGPDLEKYTAVEYWPHIYEQLKAATKKGIICVEAAGNGSSNLDAPAYGGAFNLKVRDSGCIMVGAVDPYTKERLSFSNYGSRLDASGFGRAVPTTGYGDLFNGGEQRKYTSRFSGTSSATPIVAGAIAVVSSIAKENGKTIKPKIIRKALRKSGTPQGKETSSTRVGNVPIIDQMLKRMKLRKFIR